MHASTYRVGKKEEFNMKPDYEAINHCTHEVELYLTRYDGKQDRWVRLAVGCRCELERKKRAGNKIVPYNFFRMTDTF